MKISIISFGVIHEILESTIIETDNAITVAQLRELLETDFPVLKEMHFRFALNKKMAMEDAIIQDGDTIALMPPFSGG
ncbi:MAG: MoaD/ThiS family protein [Chitinophagales bacterium]